jgi:hypothetical protein
MDSILKIGDRREVSAGRPTRDLLMGLLPFSSSERDDLRISSRDHRHRK